MNDIIRATIVGLMRALTVCGLAFLVSCGQENTVLFEQSENGIVLYPQAGEAKAVRIQFMRDDIARITASKTGKFDSTPSIMVVANAPVVEFTIAHNEKYIDVKAAQLLVRANTENGELQFFDAMGKQLSGTIGSGKFTARDDGSFGVSQSFTRVDDEAWYGLGQHQNAQVNLADENVYLTTHNLIISIPFLVSSNNYGILWDNNSESRFGKTTAPSPLFEELDLFDAKGNAGGLTARYYDGDKLLLERVEADTDYQFLSNNSIREVPMPKETEGAANLRVELEGSIAAKESGIHELLMYSSGYAKLFVDNALLLDRWRMNWNPWFHNTKIELTKGERRPIKIEWLAQGGYLRLLHHSPAPENTGERMSLTSESAKNIDYYFTAGENADAVIGTYRYLTGKSVMLPRWAYGFWQSRERYKSSSEIIEALTTYRDLEIPIDNIVLDWSYWPVDAWGSHDFDEQFFPDPKGLVDKVHDMNAQIMISVWPKFYPTTENYKALNAKGYMLNGNIEEGNLDWIYPGYLNAFYDAYNPGAREMYWQQLNEKINVHGFDAWWLDAVEPDMHSNLSFEKRKELMTPNYLGKGADVFNAYAVPHAQSVYEGDRASDPNKRVFILTRSGFGGIQRTASAIWSGDIVSRWSNLKEQIAAGISTSLAGVPNWTFDIGGFTPEDRYRYTNDGAVGESSGMRASELQEWRELNTRWYQFGAFVPLYRSHGQNPYREIYNIAESGSDEYNSMVAYTRLRYRLLPYIYSQAGDMYHKDATLMRGLGMDFPNDKVAADVDDQYMFGPAILVNPVYEYGARSREVYLPSGVRWYDFYTGELFEGGEHIRVDAPLTKMPLFVKAGSIIPTAPAIQHSDELMNADITLTIYTGADGRFELYEDDGRSYGYEKGEWSRIPFSYNDAKNELIIGERVGEFKGMQKQRNIHVRWISGVHADAANFDVKVSQRVDYSGKTVVVTRSLK